MKNISIILIGIIFTGIAISCGPAKDLSLLEPNEKIQMQNFSIISPRGEGWHFVKDKPERNLVLYKGGWSKLGISDLYSFNTKESYVEILILQLGISNSLDSLSMTEKNIFDTHIKNWFEENKKKYEKTGYGDLVEINRDSILINGKKLLVDNYRLYKCLIESEMLDGIGRKYLYFPARYKSERMFYCFINEIYPAKENVNQNNEFNDSTIVEIIKSFECAEDQE